MKIVDMHCDTVSELYEKRKKGQVCSLRENDLHVDLQKMQKSGYLLQNFALFVAMDGKEDPWEKVLALYQVYEEEMEQNTDLILPVFNWQDIEANRAAGKLSALLTVEEGGVCKGELSKLRTLYEKGVRMMTLTWNYPNEIGFPNLRNEEGRVAWQMHKDVKNSTLNGLEHRLQQAEADRVLKSYLNEPDTRNGLTKKGREFVAEMERIGMIVDVSHLSDAGFYDVLSITRKPFVASHSNARAVCPCVRNMTNDMIRKLAQRGGVMGLNFCADFLTQKPAGTSNPGTIADIAAHAVHIRNVGGIECLGLGSDFDGIDTHEELPGADQMELLYDALEKAGFHQAEIDKVFGENVLRLYKEAL